MASPLVLRSGYPFLELPGEIRNCIYQHYLQVRHGYKYDFPSKKFTTMMGEKVKIDLMYTCRQVATEMRHLPFEHNSLTFCTGYSDDTRTLFANFHLGMHNFIGPKLQQPVIRHQYSMGLGNDSCEVGIDKDVCAEVARQVPAMSNVFSLIASLPVSFPVAGRPRCRIEPEIDGIVFDPDTFMLSGQAESTQRQALLLALRLMAGQQGREPGRAADESVFRGGLSKASSVLQSIDPWIIPSQRTIDALFSLVKCTGVQHAGHAQWSDDDDEDDVPDQHRPWRNTRNSLTLGKYRVSAAAVAIDFLNSLSEENRQSLRKVVLHEDRPSIACPATHGLGLIRFMNECPLLRIERHVSLLRSAFLEVAQGPMFDINSGGGEIEDSHILMPNGTYWDYLDGGLPGQQAFRLVSMWVAEALVLPPAGMPAQRFRLVLDGGAGTEQELCSSIFDDIQEFAAFQLALQESHTRKLIEPAEPDWSIDYFIANIWGGFKDSARAIRNLSRGGVAIGNNPSYISCNFSAGELHDVGELIKQNRGLDLYSWCSVNNGPSSHSFVPYDCRWFWANLIQENILEIAFNCNPQISFKEYP